MVAPQGLVTRLIAITELEGVIEIRNDQPGNGMGRVRREPAHREALAWPNRHLSAGSNPRVPTARRATNGALIGRTSSTRGIYRSPITTREEKFGLGSHFS